MCIQDDLKQGLRRLAKAVVVITCEFEETRYAMAATAISELSMDPPSLLACINKSASIARVIKAGANFAINILHASHDDICGACSGKVKGEARFAVGDWQFGQFGMPILADAQASFECRQVELHEYGTHYLLIGEVVAVHISDQPVEPLVYADGGFNRLESIS
ncbi:flavin reductase [Croceicoccus ponticola]|uniref:Flavin reductase n=1 Tax=Croceicoccus ponticola TaxID=2217664 RepID=A0A437GUE5_9SPHN|nr:flavin reductase family protein [Croceicoccus ponticola]RVQ65012.1 flavin reductase [Croceicoccus ponticola]